MRFATDKSYLRPEIPHLFKRFKSVCVCVCMLYFIFFSFITGGQLKTVESFWTEFDVARYWNWLISWTRRPEISFKRCPQMSFIYLQSVCVCTTDNICVTVNIKSTTLWNEFFCSYIWIWFNWILDKCHANSYSQYSV